MSQYKDLASYSLLVRIRSHKTVLVEGVTDKQILSSFFLTHSLSENGSNKVLIDDVSIIADATLAGLGHKQKALQIASAFHPNHDKLSCLVDREWDGVDFNNLANTQARPYIHALTTKGHSIENYWFHADALISFLIQIHADKIGKNYLILIADNFSKILEFAAAYSLSAKNAAIISRAYDLIAADSIDWNGHSFILNQTINTALANRQVSIDFASLCNSQLQNLPTNNLDDLRWLCHGHLGEQAIRACAATLAQAAGISRETVTEIERGNKASKFHHDINYINKCNPKIIPPLDELLGWISS